MYVCIAYNGAQPAVILYDDKVKTAWRPLVIY